MKTYIVQRLYNNIASIRTTTVDMCIKAKADLKIMYNDQAMTVPLEKLENPNKFQIHKNTFQSKYNEGQTYELYDFPFIPDGQVAIILNQDGKAEVEKTYLELKNKLDKLISGFVPGFGNTKHLDVIKELKKAHDSLEKIKVKESLSRSKTLVEKTERSIKNIEFLIK